MSTRKSSHLNKLIPYNLNKLIRVGNNFLVTRFTRHKKMRM